MQIHVSLKGHQDEINSLDYSKDGRFIVSGSKDGTARIWDLDTNNHKVLEAKTTEGEDTAVLSVSVSHDGRLVAAGCRDSITLLPASSQYKSAANAAICAFRFMEFSQQMLDHLYLL